MNSITMLRCGPVRRILTGSFTKTYARNTMVLPRPWTTISSNTPATKSEMLTSSLMTLQLKPPMNVPFSAKTRDDVEPALGSTAPRAVSCFTTMSLVVEGSREPCFMKRKTSEETNPPDPGIENCKNQLQDCQATKDDLQDNVDECQKKPPGLRGRKGDLRRRQEECEEKLDQAETEQDACKNELKEFKPSPFDL